MDVEIFGQWALLLVGLLVTALAASAVVLKDAKRPGPFMWVFGLFSAGLGVWGLPFLTHYTSFVRALAAYADPGNDEEDARRLVEKLAEGNAPRRLERIGAALLMQSPDEEVEEMVAAAIPDAADDRARDLLVETKRALEGRRRTADIVRRELERGAIDARALHELDPPTRLRVARDLGELPPDRRRELQIAPEELERLRRPTLPLR